MLNPVGPLPASVYWRRRAAVLLAAMLAPLLSWALFGRGPGTPASGAAAPATSTAGAAGAADPSRQPAETLTANPPAHDPGRTGDGSVPTTTGAGGAGTSGAGQTPAPLCADTALRLTVEAGKPSYPVGARPLLTLRVQNVSSATCTRDMAASQQEVLLFAGATRVWSSNDCYPGGGRDMKALAPGRQDTYSVTWSGLSSKPRCEGSRTRVGPGTYILRARLGTLHSPDAPLAIR